MSRTFVAPGKVVVAGEYAVLDGAPALVAAVDLGVAVTVTEGGPRTVTTPMGDTRFVDAALDHAGVATGSWAFGDHGGEHLPSKPGLGGSAAATVVATFAARTLAGTSTAPADVFADAFDVHHAVQGSGSGIDVAASTWGGMLRFERDATPRPAAPVRLVVVYTGASAQTGPRVDRYRAWSGRRPFVAASRALVDAFHDDPIAAVHRNRRLLEGMAEAAGIAYRTPALDRIASLAADHGGAGKPSGAGGGDSAIAILPDAAAEAAFVDAATAEGFTVLATALAPGVHEVSGTS